MNLSNLKPPAQMDLYEGYSCRLQAVLQGMDWSTVDLLAGDLLDCWRSGRQVFLCGNGGSAANANHLVNDFLYGVSKDYGDGIRAHALSANTSVLTCLGNDISFDDIFSWQLAVNARPGDILIALSGSGNSPNILKVITQAKKMNVKSYGILGFTGGKAIEIADKAIHFDVNDMQISEDMQIIVGHMIMRRLCQIHHEGGNI